MLVVYFYIFLNIIVAFVTISVERDYEIATADVPIGDLEFYKKPEPNPVWLWIIFPVAFLIYKSWVLFCKIVNNIL